MSQSNLSLKRKIEHRINTPYSIYDPMVLDSNIYIYITPYLDDRFFTFKFFLSFRSPHCSHDNIYFSINSKSNIRHYHELEKMFLRCAGANFELI